MHASEEHSGIPDLADERRPSAPSQIEVPEGSEDLGAPPAARRWWAVAAWVAGATTLFAFLLRISLSFPINSDGANSALQSWDMLHGNLLLHGWIIGDATYYTFELPMYAITEYFFGLHSVVIHIGSAITYVIVAVCAVAIAARNSRGPALVARCGVVIAVMAAPLLTPDGVSIVLEKPDHTGTAAILLVCFLLIDRALSRRFTAPLICLILAAGELGDATVLFVAVPTVILLCAYRALVAPTIRSGDIAVVVAAVVSVPLELLIRAVIEHFGGYLMISARTGIAPLSEWPHHAMLILQGARPLFGVSIVHDVVLGPAGTAFGVACLAAAAFGFARVIWTWRTASRAEQLLCVAIVINLAAYQFSTLPVPSNAREFVAVVPFGAILAARALVPARIVGAQRVGLAAATAGIIAMVPLIAAATVPAATPAASPLAAWLEAHGLKYGVAGYWDASAVTVQSGNRVQVRAVAVTHHDGPARFAAKDWETKAVWYYPSQNSATFVIADFVHRDSNDYIRAATFEKYFGRPTSVHKVAGRIVLIYSWNLLGEVSPALPLWTATPTTPRDRR
jgi:hypothetical protein